MTPRKPKALPSPEPDETYPEPTSFRGALEKYVLPTTPPFPSPRATKKRKPTSPPPPSRGKKPTPKPNPTPQPPPLGSGGDIVVVAPPKKRRQKLTTGYAPPSKYADIPNLLRDSLGPNLLAVFVGLNPGLRTARTGHAYSHPSNLFWKLLHGSGCTRGGAPVAAARDGSLPAEHGLGLTNIVARPTRDGSELSRAEMDASVAALEAKVRRWRPEVVVLVGKAVWESVWRVRCGRGLARGEFSYGWQPDRVRMGGGLRAWVGEDEMCEEGCDGERSRECASRTDEPWEGARVFVATTTSGLAAGMKPAEKEAVWRGLGEWVVRRRAEREREGVVEAGVEGESVEGVGVEGEGEGEGMS